MKKNNKYILPITMVKSKIKNISISENKEKLALLIPVGTGAGGTVEAADSLAYGLLYLIKENNPDRIVFFTTELSNKTTLKSLKQQYFDEFGKELNKISNFIKINDIDDFEEFYGKITNQIKSLKNYRIIVDYTSGTKTMTMAASIAATVNNLELMFVSGKRGSKNIVEKGTEVLRIQNLDTVHEEKIIEDTEELFNLYRFKQAIEKLESLGLSDNEEMEFNKTSHFFLYAAYNYWDDFNHEVALHGFKIHFYKYFNDLSAQIRLNIKALKIINDESNDLQKYYILASLINNAERRAEEGKYDDAIARLYRGMELIANICLDYYSINPNDVDVEKVKDKSDKAFYNISGKLIRTHKGALKMPGIDSMYMLIHNLSTFNNVGQFYFEHRNEYQTVLQHRNTSILAHGLEMKDVDDYNDFKKGIMSLAKRLDKNMEVYLEETKFPKFNTN